MTENPTLGDLRYALAVRGGRPEPGAEIGFELDPDTPDFTGPMYVVDRELTAAVVAGDFDDVADCIPLREITGGTRASARAGSPGALDQRAAPGGEPTRPKGSSK